ncbi:acyltransferase [Cellulomonas sp. ICMP 17802]|uniref:acyltransferase n=1 Tax=Cellulomonas sp. ICMP 17802 TaxID=3239199 RepID=UPI00351B9D85
MNLAISIVNAVAGSPLIPFRLRTIIYRLAGVDVPARCRIEAGVVLRTNKLTLGSRSTINTRCIFDNRAPVVIGSRVGIGIDTLFITSSHSMSDAACRAGAGSLAPIYVRDGAWIGSRVTILPGVTIGEGCVIAAGAVVTKDCEPNSLYAGVPARLLRRLP